MSGHIGLREEMSAGRVLAQQIAQLFAALPQRICAVPVHPIDQPVPALKSRDAARGLIVLGVCVSDAQDQVTTAAGVVMQRNDLAGYCAQ